MIVKRGSVVSHSVAQQWGTGKVVEIDDVRATIRFSDGMVRKIISSHFSDLRPADPATYQPAVKEQKGKGKAGVKTVRPRGAKAKKPAATVTSG